MNDTSSLGTSSSTEKEEKHIHHNNNNNNIDTTIKEEQQQAVPHLRIDRADEPPLPPLITHSKSRSRGGGGSRMSSPDSSPSPPSSPTTTSMTRTTTLLPKLYRLVKFNRLLIFILICFSFGSIFVMLDSFQHHQRDISGCQTSYMRPEYIKQTGFDSEMTRFAGKYGLYLYREKGVDYSDQPTGVPVLFIPGHAGSYKQVRSLAAESTFYYYRNYARDNEKWQQGVRNLDFFTVDFHEEFSALHGQSILEQAEYLNDAIDYILKLYPQTRKVDYPDTTKLPDPTSVIIIGHSMGGIVARAMFTMNNYQHGTINTIITMSTPHMLPPVPFDWKISQLYDDINQFWQEGFSKHAMEADDNDKYHHESLRDISIISMAGGTLDNTVCSDSTNIGSIVPETHGFTVFSTAIPNVWTGADHVSILTCNQLVKKVSKTLIDIIDVRRGPQTKPLEERMQIMRHAFLSGLEDRKGDGSDLQLGNLTFYNLMENEGIFLRPGERLVIGQEPIAKIILLPTVANADAFAVLSDSQMGPKGRFELFLCSKVKGGYTSNATRVACRTTSPIAVPIPASTENDVYPFSGNTFSFASIEFSEMGAYHYFAVVDKNGGNGGFLIIEPFKTRTNSQVIRQSMLSIALEGVHVKTGPGLFTSIRIPSIESPILAYHLKVSRPNCRLYNNHFSPFLRQSISTMHESKFYVDLAGNHQNDEEETEVSIHGRTAFASIVSNSRDVDQNGLSFQIWMDPSCPEPLQLDLSIDWYGSAGRLGFRNGIMLATFSFIVVILVFAAQIQCYNETGIFPHFGQGLAFCLKRSLPIVMVCVAICSIAQCASPSTFYTFDDLWYLPSTKFACQDIMTGNTDAFFWWIPLAGIAMSTGIVSLLWLLVDGAIRFFAYASVFCSKQYGGINSWPMSRNQETRQQQIQRRAITTVILFLLVATFIPYQFVFVVAFLVQIVTCIRSLVRSWVVSNRIEFKKTNRYNYMLSILLLFFTLLPFNVPILLVWIRNISVHWFVPFSSDHSVIAIAPFMIYVEILTSNRKMLPRQRNRFWSVVTYLILYYIVIYAFLYGIKYAHWLYFLSNDLVVWLLLLHFLDSHYGRLSYHYIMDMIRFGSKKHS